MKKELNQMRGAALSILGALAFAAQALFGGNSSCIAANTFDGQVLTNEKDIRRTNDAAITVRHLLYKEGTTPGTGCAVCGATDLPLGVIDNTEASTGVVQTIAMLGRGRTKNMVSAVAITIGSRIFTTTGGKVTLTPVIGCYFIGRALSATTGDNQILEVEDCVPQLITDYSQVITMGSTTKAGATLAVPVTHRAVVMTTGGAEALTLANGVNGQRLLAILGTDGGDGTLTPATKTGFATIVFADAGDFAELEFVNPTVGWILIGYGGVAAPPAITV